jgi:spermidine synthase
VTARAAHVRATVAAALVGCACMAAELAAVRLQAPWFGDSAYVWTNVIGLILGALAAGAALGGRLAAAAHADRWLACLLAVAGGWLVLAPLLAAPLGSFLLPADLPLDAAMPALIRGSLAATMLLFAVPMLLLGAVAPMLVVGLASQGLPVGRAAGRVSCAGTLGSLVGTFASTHWLVPGLGCRWTLVLCGALLWLALACLRTTRRPLFAAAALLLAATGWLHTGPLRAPYPGRELLAERESQYQFLQVQREPLGGERSRTVLLINEGLDSFHSLQVAGSAFTGGAYYDWHALVPLLLSERVPIRALSIGDAAGSLRSVYAAVHPEATVDGVDIDATTLALGREFFHHKKAPGETWALDGRLLLRLAARRWQVLHVDAYAHQIYVPAHLASAEFFRLAYDRLEDGGLLACNVGALRPDDAVLRAIGTTVASVFGHATALLLPNSRNALLVARRGPPPDPRQLLANSAQPSSLHAADASYWQQLRTIAAEPNRWHDVSRGGELLTDDRPVLDTLLERGYLARRANAAVVAMRGSETPRAAELAAFQAAQQQDWGGVLRAVATSSSATAYLRELAGDARWSLRELPAAAAEYAASLALAGDSGEATRVLRKQASLGEDLQPQQRADAIADRNAWLAAAALASLVGLLLLALRLVGRLGPAAAIGLR